jgi:hypothetical protein
MVIVNMFQNEFQSEFKPCYAVGQQLQYLHSTDWHRKFCCNSSGAEWQFLPTTDFFPKDYIQATQSRKPLQCHAVTPLKANPHLNQSCETITTTNFRQSNIKLIHANQVYEQPPGSPSILKNQSRKWMWTGLSQR